MGIYRCRHGVMAAQLFRNQQISGSSPDDGLRVKLERFHGGLISRVHGFKPRTRDLISLRSTILGVRRIVYPEAAGSCPVGVVFGTMNKTFSWWC